MEATAGPAAHGSQHLKRERSSSFLPSDAPPSKAPFHSHSEIIAPLLPPKPLETKAAYFARLRATLQHDLILAAPPVSLARDLSRPGIYLYKRPIRSASPEHAALLSQGGSVFHHVVVYVVEETGKAPVALEFGPSNGMDVTANMLEEAPAAHPLKLAPELPQEAHLPMLHLGGGHHPLAAAHVQRALAFAARRSYHMLKNNCIVFADFIVRVLTGGGVRSAPLVFDALAGAVPPVDSPLLPMVQLMTGMGWHAITDGGRLMADFLAEAGAHAIAPPPGPKTEGAALPGSDGGAPGTEAAEDAGPTAPGDSGRSENTATAVGGAAAGATATVTATATATATGTAGTGPAAGGGDAERSSASSGKKRAGPRLPPRGQPSA